MDTIENIFDVYGYIIYYSDKYEPTYTACWTIESELFNTCISLIDKGNIIHRIQWTGDNI